MIILETDGCFTDGVEVATGVTVGQRRLRIEDYGKVAATFIDTFTERAVRIAPHPEARLGAARYAPQAENLYDAQLVGYKIMPEAELLTLVPGSSANPCGGDHQQARPAGLNASVAAKRS